MERTEFARRRKRLMDIMSIGGIAILPAASVKIRNRDVAFPYRPDSDFFYLTGFPEPEAVAVLIPERAQGEFIVFCREKNPERETWEGPCAGLDGVCEHYGADDAFPISDIDEILPGLLEDKERIYYSMGQDTDFDQRVMKWVNEVRSRVRRGVTAPGEFIVLSHVVHEMRLCKSRQELNVIRRAAKIGAAGHRRAMQVCRPGLKEFELEAELLHEFMRNGSRAPAYPSIVASGENGCVLHYTANTDVLKEGELVLLDAGAEYDGYASDITRTFPVNGRYSTPQKEVYEWVLAAQTAAIEKAKPGNHWYDPHQAAVRVLTKGLVEMGILRGRPAKLAKEEAYKPFYMHRTGHWLGMDVHDVGAYKLNGEWRMLEPGMVLTVEPGLYLRAGSKGLAKRWWDIAVRIEDDLLVTKEGNEVLSAEVPKTVAEIESWMAG